MIFLLFHNSSYFEIDHTEETKTQKGKGKKKKTTSTSTRITKAGNLHEDTMFDLNGVKPARYNRSLTIEGNEFTSKGWDIASKRSHDPYPGGPSSGAGGLPLAMADSAPGSTTTIDFAYFRSFPRTAVFDIRMDFVSASRTAGHAIALKDERSILDKVGDCCCKQGINLTNGIMVPGFSTLLVIIYMVISNESCDDPYGWAKNVRCQSGQYVAGFALFLNVILIWFWLFYKKQKVTITDSSESERQVRIKLGDQGALVLNVSYAHSTEKVAKTVAKLLPPENELNKFAAAANQILESANAAVVKAEHEALKEAEEDVKQLNAMLDDLHKQMETNKSNNIAVLTGKKERERIPRVFG